MGAGLKVDAVHPVRVFVVAAVPHYLRRNYPHCVYRSLRLLEDSLCLRLLPLGLLRCSPTSPPAATDPRTPTGTPSAAAATARLLLLPHVPLPVHALRQLGPFSSSFQEFNHPHSSSVLRPGGPRSDNFFAMCFP
eukprot:GHVU01172577.1.p2 GENE.GHVU01172577.1~~GHVU01172577.1.p2  ORF type:complete len:135 (-),score=11.56 GHVU01172577.1:228-632(-)